MTEPTTPDLTAQIIEMRAAGVPYERIAAELGISYWRAYNVFHRAHGNDLRERHQEVTGGRDAYLFRHRVMP